MKPENCPHENAIAAAARSGEWSPELRAHRDGCMTCAELTLVTAAMALDAEALMDESLPLPDPGVIWLRARLQEKEHDFQRATRAIVWVQRATLAVVAAAGLAFAPGFLGSVKSVFSGFQFSVPLSDYPGAASSPMLVIVVSMLVLGGLALWEMTAAHGN